MAGIPCTVCGKIHYKGKSRPVDVCGACKHEAWSKRARERGLDPVEMRRQNRLNSTRYYEDNSGKRHYVSPEMYEKMSTEQNDLCAICEKPETLVQVTGPRRLAVDHCHETGLLRGLLCSKCNKAVGCLGDNVSGLMRAVRYLEQFE